MPDLPPNPHYEGNTSMTTTRPRVARRTTAKAAPAEHLTAGSEQQDPIVDQPAEQVTSEATTEQPAEEQVAPEPQPSAAVAAVAVAGGRGFELAAPVTFAGIVWTPADGDPLDGSPIGVALAAEMAGAA